jgi:hypothetical protein
MLVEADFAAPALTPYVPPERGDFRRIDVSRTLQLLQDASGVIETFQLSNAALSLPSNQIGDDETGNDAGDGRWFFIRNSGSGILSIKNSSGVEIVSLKPEITVTLISNTNQQWDCFFAGKNILFDNNGTSMEASNVNDAIIEAYNKRNFSYNSVDEFITIPNGQQMRVYQEIIIDLGGELAVGGELIVKDI